MNRDASPVRQNPPKLSPDDCVRAVWTYLVQELKLSHRSMFFGVSTPWNWGSLCTDCFSRFPTATVQVGDYVLHSNAGCVLEALIRDRCAPAPLLASPPRQRQHNKPIFPGFFGRTTITPQEQTLPTPLEFAYYLMGQTEGFLNDLQSQPTRQVIHVFAEGIPRSLLVQANPKTPEEEDRRKLHIEAAHVQRAVLIAWLRRRGFFIYYAFLGLDLPLPVVESLYVHWFACGPIPKPRVPDYARPDYIEM